MMRKPLVIAAFALLLCCCDAAPVALARQTTLLRRSVTIERGCPKAKFRTLSRYKGNRWSRVFRDRTIAPVLRNLLKRDYRNLIYSLQLVDYLDNGTLIDSNGALRLVGGVPALYTISEAILIVEPCGNIYVAILDEGKRILYYTNDREYADNLEPTIREWTSDIEKRRSRLFKQPELQIMFKSR